MTTPREEKIIRAFKQRDWNELKTQDSWQIFKIMAEFVDGFEKLGSIGPCVSIFGSARTEPGSKYYQLAEDIAFKLKTEKTMKIQFEILNQDMMNILNQLAKIEPMNIAEYKAIIIKDFVDSNFFELVKKIKQSHEKGKKSNRYSITYGICYIVYFGPITYGSKSWS